MKIRKWMVAAEAALMGVLMPGDAAPDWVATTYDGGEIKLSDFRGQFVLVDFRAMVSGLLKLAPSMASARSPQSG